MSAARDAPQYPPSSGMFVDRRMVVTGSSSIRAFRMPLLRSLGLECFGRLFYTPVAPTGA